MKRITFLLIAFLIIGIFSSADAATKNPSIYISPKLSYVGWLGIGAEFAPLYKINDNMHVMAEANWDFWEWNGGAGYIYGEVNAVYNAQMFKMGSGKDAYPLWPYVGGGLILGTPLGTADFGGSFTGGIGFGIFGGVKGKWDPYTWFMHLKYAHAPITWKYSLPFVGEFSDSTNALGVGFEFGVRLPLM